MKYYYSYETPVNKIQITEENNSIINILYSENTTDCTKNETSLIKSTFLQLSEYFEGKRKTFDIPIKLKGTEFQKKVWAALFTIPYGETWSYKQLAENVECKDGYRAVGLANNRNPIAIIVPCHRVIGTNGSLTGYAGGLNIKKYLLNLERNNSTRSYELF